MLLAQIEQERILGYQRIGEMAHFCHMLRLRDWAWKKSNEADDRLYQMIYYREV